MSPRGHLEGHLVPIGFTGGSNVLTDQIQFSFFVEAHLEGHLVTIGFTEGSNVLTDQIHFIFL